MTKLRVWVCVLALLVAHRAMGDQPLVAPIDAKNFPIYNLPLPSGSHVATMPVRVGDLTLGSCLLKVAGTLPFSCGADGTDFLSPSTGILLGAHAATSVIGRAVGSPGSAADIVATVDGQILQRLAGALTWATTLPSTSISGTPNTVAGFNGSGLLNSQTLASELAIVAGSLGIATGGITTTKLAAGAVTYAKIQNETNGTILGNGGAVPAAPSEVTVLSSLSLSVSGLGLANVPAGTPVLGEILATGVGATMTPPSGFGRCRYDATNLDWTCLSAFGVETHGVQSSVGANFITGIRPDGSVIRSGVSATQVAGLWPVAITGNGSDLNPASTPLDRLSQSGATTGNVPSWNGTAWVPAAPAATGISALTGGGTATGPGSVPLTLHLDAGATVLGLLPLTNQAAPTGTGFAHITTGAWDGVARAVDLSSADATGILAAAREPAHTGDVTNTAGSLALTIAAHAVSNADIRQSVGLSLVGNPGVGTSNVQDVTCTGTGQIFQTTGAGIVCQTLAYSTLTGTVPAAGLGSFSNGSVLYWNGGLAEDHANFLWDSTNHRLGIGTTGPSAPLHIIGNSTGGVGAYVQNSNAGANAYSELRLINNVGTIADIFLGSSAYAGSDGGPSHLTIETSSGVGNYIHLAPSGAIALTLTSAAVFFPQYATGGLAKILPSTGGQLALAAHPADYLASGDSISNLNTGWPAAADVLVSTGTGPAGDSTFTESTTTHLLTVHHLTLSGDDGSSVALALIEAATQQIAKSNGRLDVGTTGAFSTTLMTNNISRLVLSSTGALQLTAYGAGHLQTDASGNVSVDGTTYQPLVSFPPSPEIAIGTGTGLTGFSTFTLTSGAVILGSSNGSGYAFVLNQAADQQINKSGGNVYIGTSDGHDVRIYSNTITREIINSGGIWQGVNLAGMSWTTSGTPIVPTAPTMAEWSLTPPSTTSAASLQGLYRFDGVTETLTGTTHATSHEGGLYLAANTMTSSTAITVDQAATLTVAGPWTCSGSVTCTSRPAVLVKAGPVEIDGSDANTVALALNQFATQEIAKANGRLDVGTTGAFIATLMTNNASRVVALATGEVQIPNLSGGSDALVYANAASGQLARVALGSGLSLSGGTLSATGSITWPTTTQVVYSTGSGPAGSAAFVWDNPNNRIVLNNSDANGVAVLLTEAATQQIAKSNGRFDMGTLDANLVTLMTNNASRVTISSSGVVAIVNLSGTGTRCVQADPSGALSTIAGACGSGGTSYTFSTGLTNSGGTVTSNLSTGVLGGQSVVGGTANGDNLTITSSSAFTPGQIKLGISASIGVFDEASSRVSFGQLTGVDAKMHIVTTNDTSVGSIAAWDTRHFVVGAASGATGGGFGVSTTSSTSTVNLLAVAPNTAWWNLGINALSFGFYSSGSITPGLYQDSSSHVGIFTLNAGGFVKAANGNGALSVVSSTTATLPYAIGFGMSNTGEVPSGGTGTNPVGFGQTEYPMGIAVSSVTLKCFYPINRINSGTFTFKAARNATDTTAAVSLTSGSGTGVFSSTAVVAGSTNDTWGLDVTSLGSSSSCGSGLCPNDLFCTIILQP